MSQSEFLFDGQTVEESRVINLKAGQKSAVAFGFNARTAEGLASSLRNAGTDTSS